MSGRDFIDRARSASEHLKRARGQIPMANGTTVISVDGMVAVKLDPLGNPDITIDRSRTYSYEEYEVKMVIIDTYNQAIRAHESQMRDISARAGEVLDALFHGRKQ